MKWSMLVMWYKGSECWDCVQTDRWCVVHSCKALHWRRKSQPRSLRFVRGPMHLRKAFASSLTRATLNLNSLHVYVYCDRKTWCLLLKCFSGDSFLFSYYLRSESRSSSFPFGAFFFNAWNKTMFLWFICNQKGGIKTWYSQEIMI